MKDAGLEVMRNTSQVGETKVVVQKWSNNVAQLSKDVQKQVGLIFFNAFQLEILQGLSSNDNQGVQGEGSMKIDYFENTVEKLKREVDLLMKCAEQIMALPSTKNTHINQFK